MTITESVAFSLGGLVPVSVTLPTTDASAQLQVFEGGAWRVPTDTANNPVGAINATANIPATFDATEAWRFKNRMARVVSSTNSGATLTLVTAAL